MLLASVLGFLLLSLSTAQNFDSFSNDSYQGESATESNAYGTTEAETFLLRTKRIKRADVTPTAIVLPLRRNLTSMALSRVRVDDDPFRGIMGGGRNARRRQNITRTTVTAVRIGSRGVINSTSTTRSGRPRTTPLRRVTIAPTVAPPPTVRRTTATPAVVRVRPVPVTPRRRIGVVPPPVTVGPGRNITAANLPATTRPPYIMGWAPGGK